MLKLVKFFKAGNALAGSQLAILLTGIIVSFIVAYLAIKFLLKYVQTHDFKPFGWYRIILGLVVILCGFFM